MDASSTPTVAVRCTVPMMSGPCGREAYDEDDRCICHSEKPDKDVQIFNAALEEVLAGQDLDFTRFVFPEGVSFYHTEFASDVCFAHARFLGGVSFDSATFKGEADFGDVEFWNDAFLGADFRQKADFLNARFRKAVHFQESTLFQGEAVFWGAEFQGEAEFDLATFLEGANFMCAHFRSWASFFGARFLSWVIFHGAIFEDGAQFTGTERSEVFSRGADANFWGSHFHQPEKVVFQKVFLGRARFLEANVEKVDFTGGVEWARRKAGGFALYDELAPEAPFGEKDYALIGKLYRELKYNYEERRDPVQAGDFHFGEMHMRRLSYPPRNAVFRFLKRNVSLIAWYRWISGYGESYRLATLWVLGVVLVFAVLFTLVPCLALQTADKTGGQHVVRAFWPSFLHSVMCFLFRGDRPYQPVSIWGHYLSVAEGIIGAPLLAMFVLALNRRFKR